MTQALPKNESGEYDKYAWPGGYPIYYLSEYVVMCPDCANTDADEDDPITASDINWEDPSLYCDVCGKRIESAYADE